ncbi:hypothetical protein SAMN02745216_05027 [Desulfatibacillum alkenivorans DSM 16219]|jgi:hypothetical protein|uniref:Uncharacterized protein n=1 Tax=Desulfatibacillum alkenivorans DSM 16219 TaxID=1121393 RepID=A0A1M6ZSH6_9BACT|nr:hypothetical protein [Desulfatibacillum alkenivorans]SHL33422.1 hypothetical protein SAMN02745216_05027 [Desulfatibacillum alkenivorans DSM 16219]
MFSVIVSIIAGAIGYLIVTFHFQPILRFRAVRFQIISDLVFYANAINAENLNVEMQKRVEERRVANRRHSADLAGIYCELPVYYKYYLSRRGMDIERAIKVLIGLSNTLEFEPANKAIDNINRCLRIKPFD